VCTTGDLSIAKDNTAAADGLAVVVGLVEEPRVHENAACTSSSCADPCAIANECSTANSQCRALCPGGPPNGEPGDSVLESVHIG
jgi:hypothetical protein